jgi:hypothetical protein
MIEISVEVLRAPGVMICLYYRLHKLYNSKTTPLLTLIRVKINKFFAS